MINDPDWDTMIIQAPDRELTHEIIDHHVGQMVLNTWSGGELYALLQRSGLNRVAVADEATGVLADFAEKRVTEWPRLRNPVT